MLLSLHTHLTTCYHSLYSSHNIFQSLKILSYYRPQPSTHAVPFAPTALHGTLILHKAPSTHPVRQSQLERSRSSLNLPIKSNPLPSLQSPYTLLSQPLVHFLSNLAQFAILLTYIWSVFTVLLCLSHWNLSAWGKELDLTVPSLLCKVLKIYFLD